MSQLPEVLQQAPRQRLLVKISGNLYSPKPITIAEGPQTAAVLVRKRALSWSTNRISTVLENITTIAEDVEVKVKVNDVDTKYASGPTLNLPPSLLDGIDTTITTHKETFQGNRLFSAAMSVFVLNFPWRMSQTTEIVPQNRHVFVAMDAVLDSNGRVTLIESNRISARKIISYRHYVQTLDDLNDRATIWKSFAIASAVTSAVLAGVAALSR